MGSVEGELIWAFQISRTTTPANWAFENAVLGVEAFEFRFEVLVRQNGERDIAITVSTHVVANEFFAVLPTARVARIPKCSGYDL